MTDTSISDYRVKVRKDQSLTSILKEMIEKMKNKNPDGIFISDDKITHKEILLKKSSTFLNFSWEKCIFI